MAVDAYKRLNELVFLDDKRTEVESRNYLLECLRCLKSSAGADLLCHSGVVSSVISFSAEDTGRYGPCDVVVIADMVEATEEIRRKAYVWEVKAPQVFLFEPDTANRARPTHDLMKAENQLFHYHAERAGSDAFRDEFRIVGPEDVVMGGVIIGRRDKMLRPKAGLHIQNAARLYHTAVRLRRKYIYQRNNMELMTWSNVLRRLQPAQLAGDVLEGLETVELEPSETELRAAVDASQRERWEEGPIEGDGVRRRRTGTD